MIKVVAPGRVNLIGDHTDYTGGLAMPMAINHATVVEGRREGMSVDLISVNMEGRLSLPLPVRDAAATRPSWGRYVAAVTELIGPTAGFTGTVSSDIPIGGGLSSSAALMVAIALALGADGPPADVARLCQRAEMLATGVPTGIMDQLCILSALPDHASMIDFNTLEVEPVPMSDEVDVIVSFVAPRALENSGYSQRVNECRQAEDLIGPLRRANLDDVYRIADPTLRRRARHVVTENDRVIRFAGAMRRGDWAAAGTIMNEGHHSLAEDYEVSTAAMDRAVAESLDQSQVFGSRMTGGGFGGCIVSLCRRGTNASGWVVRSTGAARHVTI